MPASLSGSVEPIRAARRAQSRQARPEEAQELTSGTPKAGTLNMLPRLDVAIPRAEEQLTAVQHLLILGCWLTQRPRRAARHHSRRAHLGITSNRPRKKHLKALQVFSLATRQQLKIRPRDL